MRERERETDRQTDRKIDSQTHSWAQTCSERGGKGEGDRYGG
jgi:hypothetical protein